MNNFSSPIRETDTRIALFAMIFTLFVLLITGIMFGWICYTEGLAMLESLV